MSVSEQHSVIIPRAPAKPRPGTGLVQRLMQAVERWQRNRARAALELLDDRYLADIGIARNDIPWAVDEIFHSKTRSLRTPSPSLRPVAPASAGRPADHR